MTRTGIDLGGTKTELVVLDDGGVERWRHRRPTPSTSYEMIIAQIVAMVDQAERETGERLAHIGIGTPGAISPASGLMKNSNTVCLNGKPFDRDLRTALGRSVRLANDANCFALSEATDGAGRGSNVVFGVILGTGTGGGVVVGGRVLEGPNSIAGEWGHNPLPWPQDDERPGRRCYCGQSGCIETFLSGPGLKHDHGHGIDPQAIVTAAAAGDRVAEATLARYESRLARALASVINILDPEVIVLGGGLSQIQRLYQNVPRLWGQWVFSDHVATQLKAAVHGDSSGVRGAAWL